MVDSDLKFKAGVTQKRDKTDVSLEDVIQFLRAETEEDFEVLKHQFNLFLFSNEAPIEFDIDGIREMRNNLELAIRWNIRLNKALNGDELTERDLENLGLEFERNEEFEYTEAFFELPAYSDAYMNYLELANKTRLESDQAYILLLQQKTKKWKRHRADHKLIIPCGVYQTLNPKPTAVLSKALAELIRRHTTFVTLDFDPTTRNFFCRYNDLMGALWHEMVEGWNASRVFACKYCGTIHFTKGERGMKREFCPGTQCANKYNNLHNKLRREAKRAEDALKEAEESEDASIIEAASEQVSRTEYALISFENDGGFHGRKE